MTRSTPAVCALASLLVLVAAAAGPHPGSEALAAEVRLIADIAPGSPGSTPQLGLNVNGILFFAADDGLNGAELWKSDGTAAGTLMVRDIRPGAAGSNPGGFRNVGGTLFFPANDGTHGDELWKSDGTAAGTVLVADIEPGAAGSAPLLLTGVGGTLFLSPCQPAIGCELWKTDGTAAGTVLVKDINPGIGTSDPAWPVNVGGTLFFTADDGTHGRELWRSDGTAAGTVLVKDIHPAGSSSPRELTPVGGTLFFAADDGTGAELWKSDGTAAGTVLVRDIQPGGGSFPQWLAELNGMLLFSAAGAAGHELWKSDGTAAGTVLVKDIDPVSHSTPQRLTRVNTLVFFHADDGTHGRELWRSDGTAAGTTLVKDIVPGAGTSDPTGFTPVNGRLFFAASDGTTGTEFWATDGTTAGTALVRDLNPGAASSLPVLLSRTNVNGTLFFGATDGVTGTELWAVFPEDRLVVGAGPGGGPHVKAFDSRAGAEVLGFFAFDPGLTSGARVAAGDLTGDGVPDLLAGAGPGGGPHVRVFDGASLAELHSFFAYPLGFTGGVYVAAGDVTGDGRADLVTGTGAGGAAHVRVLDGVSLAELHSFFAYDPGFTGGVYVAAGDVTGDGYADLVTGVGVGGGPHVRVFDGRTLAEVMSFFAYDPGLTSGVRVAAGDVTGDGVADIVTGAGPGGGPHVKVFDGKTGAELMSFFAYGTGFLGGVYVGAGFVNEDGRADVITGTGVGGAAHVKVFDGATGAELRSFFAYDPGFVGGVLVAGSNRP